MTTLGTKIRTQLGTWNVRTIYDDEKRDKIVREMKFHGLEVLEYRKIEPKWIHVLRRRITVNTAYKHGCQSVNELADADPDLAHFHH
jgi:hypothetical protein